MITAAVKAEAIEMAQRIGWLEATCQVAQHYGLTMDEGMELGHETEAARAELARERFRTVTARGGMRHVGNSGRA